MAAKTTVELREPLLEAARQAAAAEGSSLRALIEEGLELALERRLKRKPFTLRKASVRGHGMQDGIREGDWSRIRALIYEGRGE